MYVCVCRAVTEHEVKAAIDSGADTVESVTRVCGAADDCGACCGVIRDMIEDRWGEQGGCPARHLRVLPERAA